MQEPIHKVRRNLMVSRLLFPINTFKQENDINEAFDVPFWVDTSHSYPCNYVHTLGMPLKH